VARGAAALHRRWLWVSRQVIPIHSPVGLEDDELTGFFERLTGVGKNVRIYAHGVRAGVGNFLLERAGACDDVGLKHLTKSALG
jgi:hypothetical protein